MLRAAATGPIAVEGADPGDVLRVDLLALCGSTAMHNLRGGRGFLADVRLERRVTVMPIEDGRLRFPGGLTIPINPSIGLVATTPREIQRTSSDSGPYGGIST